MSSVQDYSETYTKTTTGKITAIRLSRALFFGCFFVSIFVANTIWKNEASWIGYLHETMVLDFQASSQEALDYLKEILMQRLPMWIFLVILGRTRIGRIGAQVFGSWQGFLLGFLLSALIIRYGIVGMFIFVLLGFPQMIVYVLAYLFLYQMNFNVWRYRKVAAIVLTLLFLTGIVLESYVNLIFLSKMSTILKFF